MHYPQRVTQLFGNIADIWKRGDKTELWTIVVLCVAVLVVRALFTLYFPLPIGWDEAVYRNLGHNLSSAPLHYSTAGTGWSDFDLSTDPLYGSPNMLMRPPLLPYTFALLEYVHLGALIPLLIPLVGIGCVFLVYLLARALFTVRVGVYAAMLFVLSPYHIYYSARAMTDVLSGFFTLVTVLLFWHGFVQQRNGAKVLFGFFFALTFLARYNVALWLVPFFALCMIAHHRSLRFLKDTHVWYSLGVFAVTLIPWFMLGLLHYGNPLGGLVHIYHTLAGVPEAKPLLFYFTDTRAPSLVGLWMVLLLSLIYLQLTQQLTHDKRYLFLLLWLSSVIFCASVTAHKETRYVIAALPVFFIIPAVCIGTFRKSRHLVLGGFGVVCLIITLCLYDCRDLDGTMSGAPCFRDGIAFVSSDAVEQDALIVTDLSPIVHYYTGKDTLLPTPHWGTEVAPEEQTKSHGDRPVYIFFTNYSWRIPQGVDVQRLLEQNHERVFVCSSGTGYTAVFKQ